MSPLSGFLIGRSSCVSIEILSYILCRAFMLSYLKMIKMAIHRLHFLCQDVVHLFFMVDDKDVDAPEIEQIISDSGCGHLRILMKTIETKIVSMAGELLRLSESRNDPVLLSSLMTHACLGEPTLQFYPDELGFFCSICSRPSDTETLQKLRQQAEAGGDLLATNARLKSHHQECAKRHLSIHTGAVATEWFRLAMLHDKTEVKATAMFKDLDIYDELPAMLQRHPIFVPEWRYPREAWSVVGLKSRDCLGRSCIHRLLDAGSFEIEWGLHAGTLEEQDVLGRTILHIICGKGNSQLVQRLIHLGADIHKSTIWGALPLHYGAAVGSAEVCRILLSTTGIRINEVDHFSRTALFYAVRHGHAEVASLLLAQTETDPNASVNGFRESPLIGAIAAKNELCVRLLLANNVNLCVKNDQGDNVIHFAVGMGNNTVVRLVVESAISLINEKNEYGSSPLLWAVNSGSSFLDIIRYLLSHEKLDVNSTDIVGRSAIMWAAYKGDMVTASCILMHSKIDLTLKDADGLTAMEIAIKVGHQNMAQLLALYD